MNSNAAVDVPSVAQDAPIAGSTRWIQLALGLLCMMAISSPQYVWTLFTKPLMGKLGVTLAELQITFSILIVLQTFLSPVQGFLDRSKYVSADTPAISRPRFWILAMVDPLGRVSGVGNTVSGVYEASGLPQRAGVAGGALVVGCEAGGAGGNGVGE